MDQKIEKGLCQCGCGKRAPVAKQSDSRKKYVRGQPIKFICGHNNRGRIGPNHPSWRGGKTLGQGYVFIKKPDHPKATSGGYIQEHILIAEEVLGKPLPDNAIIHHINENISDNRKENLVICQDRAYHNLLHQKMRALKACGHANWRKCKYCKKYDDSENLYINNNTVYHKKCACYYRKQLKARKEEVMSILRRGR